MYYLKYIMGHNGILFSLAWSSANVYTGIFPQMPSGRMHHGDTLKFAECICGKISKVNVRGGPWA